MISKALFGNAERPLVLGPENSGIILPCFVLEDGRRVLSQRGMLGTIGYSTAGGARQAGESRLAELVSRSYLRAFVSPKLIDAVRDPISFELANGKIAFGYESWVLVDICQAVLKADEAGNLTKNHKKIIAQCNLLVREFAKIGLVALIDEHTGYQAYRHKYELQEIINAYISEDLREWTKTFPDEFYEQIFRLRGWAGDWRRDRPGVVGTWTNEYVYRRLAPGVLAELKRKTPSGEHGYRQNRFHQWLTGDVGHPALREHLEKILVVMRLSHDWDHFASNIQRAIPMPGEQVLLPYADANVRKKRIDRIASQEIEVQDI